MNKPVKRKQSRELAQLNRTINLYPDAAVNYMLRGEYWLKAGDLERAVSDLETAIELAQEELAKSAWEYREQAVIDRAQTLLRLAQQV